MDDNLPTERSWVDRHLWQIQPVRDLLWFASLLLCAAVAYQLRGIVIPVLFAFGLAYLCLPIIDWAEHHLRCSPSVAATLLLLLLLCAAAGLGIWLVPLVADQVIALVERAPADLEAAVARLNWQGEALSISQLSAELIQPLKENPLAALRPVFVGTGTTLNFVESTIGATAYLLVNLAVVPVYFWCFATRFHDLTDHMLRYLPAERRQRTRAIALRMDRAVASYVRGRLLVSGIMGVAFAIGWSPLVTNVPYWLLVALLTALLSLIPYGAGLGWLIALVLKAIAISSAGDTGLWQWLIGLGGPTAVYALVQGAEHAFMTPWVQSKSTQLNVVTVIIAILVGGAVAGILGMVVAIPVTACGKILLQEICSGVSTP